MKRTLSLLLALLLLRLAALAASLLGLILLILILILLILLVLRPRQRLSSGQDSSRVLGNNVLGAKMPTKALWFMRGCLIH